MNDQYKPADSATGNADKTLMERAQQAIGDAVEATVDAVKEHPIAAASIAAGAAAAVAGAAYGASKLMGSDDTDAAKKKD